MAQAFAHTYLSALSTSKSQGTFQVVSQLLTPVVTSQVMWLKVFWLNGCAATRPTLPTALTSDTNFRNLGAALMPPGLVTRTVVAMSLMAIGLSLVSPSPRSESVSDDFPFLDQVLFKIRAMADGAPSP